MILNEVDCTNVLAHVFYNRIILMFRLEIPVPAHTKQAGCFLGVDGHLGNESLRQLNLRKPKLEFKNILPGNK